jgi:4-hydroxythreonine-4-phosphate dehydrogenase
MANGGIANHRPVIGITLGDPAGIGPEVILKALADRALRRQARFMIYGLNEVLAYGADQLEIEPFWYRVQHDSRRSSQPMVDDVVVLDFDDANSGYVAQIKHEPTKIGGLVSMALVEAGIADALRPLDHPRHIDALVTGPISKQAWQLAGFKWPGHTELLAHRTRAKRHAMMFVSPRLRVTLATTHIPLMQVRNVLTIGRVIDAIELGRQACIELGIPNPVIAVTGLNPHAGECGQFGDEEHRLITPAINVARDSGIDVRGPFPGDTIFIDAAAGNYDLVVAMYHDQGLIPVKLLGWDKAVNMTVGLPIIRTSPDHGTAYDIAGQNRASAGSMTAAIELALQLVNERRRAADTAAGAKAEPAA